MTALRLAWFELRRFRGRMRLAGLAFLVIVPTLYGALYLLAYWNPFGKLDAIPVAVVNEDRPVRADGKRVDAGHRFVEQLKARPTFDWRFTDAQRAAEGLRDGRYYFVITVPSDFSRRLTSVARSSPRRAALLVRLDDANGFVVGIVARTAELEIQEQINAAAVSAYAETALGGVTDARSRLQRAARGARRLARGAAEAHRGTVEVDDGLGRLQAGATQLASGAAEVSDGAQRLQGAVDVAAAALTRALDEAAQPLSRLASGADLLAQGARRAARRLAAGTRQAVDGLAALARDLPELRDDAAFRALRRAARTADRRARRLRSGTGQVAEGVAAVAAAGNRLVGRKDELTAQLRQGTSDVDRLAAGAGQVADGAVRLRDGLSTALDGTGRLREGTAKLARGNRRLADGLADAVAKLPALDARERARQADVLGNPVALRQSNAHPAHTYGRGLAPFFFSIALWVFGIVAYLMLRPTIGEALASPLRDVTVALATWLPAAILGVAGAAVLYLVVEVGLGLDAVSPARTIGVAALAVCAFTAVILVLRMAFGAVGDALALVLLIVQLVSCGGLYPVQTTPGVLQALSPVAPMTYLVDGFRVTMTGGQDGRLLLDVLVLAGVLAVALCLATAVVHRQRTWTMSRLKPELEL